MGVDKTQKELTIERNVIMYITLDSIIDLSLSFIMKIKRKVGLKAITTLIFTLTNVGDTTL